MTANVASQPRSSIFFDVGACGPHVDGPIGHSLMVADRLDLLRMASFRIFPCVSRPGSPTISSVVRGSTPLATRFTVAVMGSRTHTYSSYSMLCDMVNRDIALRVSELMRAAQRSFPVVVRPLPGTVFDPLLVPAFVRTLAFGHGGGEVLRLVLCTISSVAERPTKRKATATPAGSPGSMGKATLSLPQVCRMFARTGTCNLSP